MSGCIRTITTPSCHILTTSITCVLPITIILDYRYAITKGYKPLSILVEVNIAITHEAMTDSLDLIYNYNTLYIKIYYNIILSSVTATPHWQLVDSRQPPCASCGQFERTVRRKGTDRRETCTACGSLCLAQRGQRSRLPSFWWRGSNARAPLRSLIRLPVDVFLPLAAAFLPPQARSNPAQSAPWPAHNCCRFSRSIA